MCGRQMPIFGDFFCPKKNSPTPGRQALIFNDWFDINDCIINHSISTFFFPIRRRSICGLQTRKKRNIDIRINIDRFFLNVGVTLGSPERPESSILFFKGWDIFFPSKV